MASRKKTKFYAYFIPGRNISGVTADWKKCEAMVKGVTGARFKAFDEKDEADEWLLRGARYVPKPHAALIPGIYFDAGTGRGSGVEISVTDEKGKNLLHRALPQNSINRFGKHRARR